MKTYQVTVGHVYKFIFKSYISNLNGIYKLTNMMTIDELINNYKIDIYKHTFEPNNVSQETFETDIYPDLSSSVIYKLQSVKDMSVIWYIPECVLSKQPIYDIRVYFDLGFAVNLGIYKDIGRINSVKSKIENMLISELGVNKDVIIFTTKEVWMTDEEYKDIENERNALITNNNSIYSRLKALEDEISRLQHLVDEYEKTLIGISY